jgi:glutathione peroxidase
VNLHDVPIKSLDGRLGTLRDLTDGRPTLLVNVASRCGHTPQYADLQQLHERYADRGFRVVGAPCNQFAEEEPGSAEEIAEFCSSTYGVTFRLTEKIRVNGKRRHPLYAALCSVRDDNGYQGDVRWNFEKFLINSGGASVGRFEPAMSPRDFRLEERIESLLSE